MSELNFGRILRHAELYRDELAVCDLDNGHESRYGEHIDRVGRVCGALSALGIKGDMPFAVLAGASHAYIELWRAGLAGGGIINPLNSRLAPEEMIYILNDSGAEVLFVDDDHADIALAFRTRVPSLRRIVQIGAGRRPDCDGHLEDLMTASTSALPAEPSATDAAVLMYTGGTTGLPKGVILSQKAVTLVIYRSLIEFPIAPGFRFLNFMPMFHIGSITSWGLLVPGGGATFVLPAYDAVPVNRAIDQHGINLIGAVPTMLAQLIDQPDFTEKTWHSLRLILYGAAPMPQPLLERLLAISPDLSLVQSYGMTECASTVSALKPQDHREGGELLGSVGRACIGVDLETRHADGRKTETNEVGEIYVRCDSAMTAYWNKPEQTKDSLVDDWYRTGDAGRVDERGYLFLADRVKDMIVSGGENVYSLEVENAIVSHPDVLAVAVVGLPHDVWGEAVHAVVVCDPDAIDEATLDAHARKTIAGFKVPKTWTLQREALPLSAAGKVLKRELRDRFAPAH